LTENELLKELMAQLNSEPLQPNEVTSRMLADATGLTIRGAYERLERGVREGSLEWRWVRNGVNRVHEKAYRKVD